jgi:hybrid cluster-associated redox disulfide protein
MQMKITKEMSIREAIELYPQVAPVFVQHGMGCLGCAIASFETIEEGALAHGIDVDALIADLNAAIDQEESE